MASTISKAWWKEAVIFQIYPSSFKDSNGDGLGDLQGIISKVDYLASLNVDAIWLSPIYKSPQVDMGYDISDYRGIHEPYGTIEDVETLIAELEKRGMKLLMDLVVNHTSNEHPWFLQSKSSASNNPKRDWYIWKKGKIGPDGEQLPPNNWESLFKGSAWDYDADTDEWYFHIFHAAQPCLNWENDEVRNAIHDYIHFWLKKGLGGLRIDAINLISKPEDFADLPATQAGYHQSCFELIKNRPKVHQWLKEMRTEVFDQYKDLVYIGECGGTNDLTDVKNYILPSRRELDLIFQFELMEVDSGPLGAFSGRNWQLSELKALTKKWQTILRPAWNTFHLENHDSGRSVNRFGRTHDPALFPAVSKLLAFFSMTLGGTIFLHQGQEIGTQNLTEDIPLHEYKDMATHSDFEKTKALRKQSLAFDTATSDAEIDMSDVLTQVRLKARDHARAPIAWDASPNAGFSTSTPWMTLNSDWKHINVAAQESDKTSVLNTWRELIRFRRQYADELVYGDFDMVDEGNESVVAYTRTSSKGIKLLVALNWSEKKVSWAPPPSSESRKMLQAVGRVQDGGEKVELDGYACTCWKVWSPRETSRAGEVKRVL